MEKESIQTPTSPRHICELNYTLAGDEYERLLDDVTSPTKISSPKKSPKKLTAREERDQKAKIQSKLFWLQVSNDISKLYDMENVYKYLQWASLLPKRNKATLKFYFALWKRSIPAQKLADMSNELLARKQTNDLKEAFEQLQYTRVQLSSKAFMNSIDDGAIISGKVTCSDFVYPSKQIENIIKNEEEECENESLHQPQTQETIELPSFIDPIRIIGSHAIPRSTFNKLESLRKKEEMPPPKPPIVTPVEQKPTTPKRQKSPRKKSPTSKKKSIALKEEVKEIDQPIEQIEEIKEIDQPVEEIAPIENTDADIESIEREIMELSNDDNFNPKRISPWIFVAVFVLFLLAGVGTFFFVSAEQDRSFIKNNFVDSFEQLKQSISKKNLLEFLNKH